MPGGGRWRVAGPGRSDVRRGRELAQVDKAGENRNPRSGGSLAGRGGRLQVGTGPGWGSPAPWGPSPPPGTLALSLRRAPCPPLPFPSRLPPGSSSSSAVPAQPHRHHRHPAASAPPSRHPGTHRDPHSPLTDLGPLSLRPGGPGILSPNPGGPGITSYSPSGPGTPSPNPDPVPNPGDQRNSVLHLWWPWSPCPLTWLPSDPIS